MKLKGQITEIKIVDPGKGLTGTATIKLDHDRGVITAPVTFESGTQKKGEWMLDGVGVVQRGDSVLVGFSK